MRCEQDSVERDTFTGTHFHCVTGAYGFRTPFVGLSVGRDDTSGLRTHIKQGTDVSACPADGSILKLFAH